MVLSESGEIWYGGGGEWERLALLVESVLVLLFALRRSCEAGFGRDGVWVEENMPNSSGRVQASTLITGTI